MTVYRQTYPVVMLRINFFASCWIWLVIGMVCVGVEVATNGRPSEALATCVNKGGMLCLFHKTGGLVLDLVVQDTRAVLLSNQRAVLLVWICGKIQNKMCGQCYTERHSPQTFAFYSSTYHTMSERAGTNATISDLRRNCKATGILLWCLMSLKVIGSRLSIKNNCPGSETMIIWTRALVIILLATTTMLFLFKRKKI